MITPNFERMYYNLVAGFDVYAKAQEQVSFRLYMDLQRREAEHLFLNFMPAASRKELRQGWYNTFWSGLKVGRDDALLLLDLPTAVPFQTDNVMAEFFELLIRQRFRKEAGVHFDPINYQPPDIDRRLARHIGSEAELDREFGKISHWSGPFVQAIPGKGDMAQVRFRRANAEDLVYTMVLNRYHASVAFITGDDERLDKRRDTIHVIKGFVGSYPNVYFDVPFDQAPRFLRMLVNSQARQDGFRRFLRPTASGAAMAGSGRWQTFLPGAFRTISPCRPVSLT